MVRFQGIFHNIGQGLFYSGTIKSNCEEFNFVYDCGTSSCNKERLIHSAIERIENYTKKLNLLVISHFHSDHINGLDILLKKYEEKEIDTIIIPYFTPQERLLYAFSNPEQDEWYYNFLADPVEYLINHKVKKILLIIQNGNGEDYPPNNDSKDNLEDKLPDDELPKEYSNFERSGKLSPKKTKGYLQWNIEKNILWWRFAFYNYRVESEELKKRFLECVKNIEKKDTIDINTIKNIIKNKRNEVKQCYEPLSKDLFKDFNNTSLIMYHAPFCNCKSSPYILDSRFFCSCNQQFFDIHYPQSFCYIDQNHKQVFCSTFLTGDINLKDSKKYVEIEDHFNNNNMNMERIAVCLVPHHGSKSNWNEKIIDDLPYCKFFPISAGIGNKYGHPNYDLICEIYKKGKFPIWCNECNYFAYRITLRKHLLNKITEWYRQEETNFDLINKNINNLEWNYE